MKKDAYISVRLRRKDCVRMIYGDPAPLHVLNCIQKALDEADAPQPSMRVKEARVPLTEAELRELLKLLAPEAFHHIKRKVEKALRVFKG